MEQFMLVRNVCGRQQWLYYISDTLINAHPYTVTIQCEDREPRR